MRPTTAFRLVLTLLSFVPMTGQTGKLRLLVYDPGHFHATLLQKEMLPDLAPRVGVYAPLGPELVEYLSRVSLFNNRLERPTRWELDVHTGSNAFDRMLGDHGGDVVVFSGHNRGKIDRILAALAAGLHVLADKPWITAAADMPKLEQALDLAARKKLAAYDIMTERYEITSQVMRELVSSRDVFGQLEPGNTGTPAIFARSVHHIKKTVAGVALKRPAWFFDISDYGDGLQDVGTHPVDLIQWTAFPDQKLDYRKDVQVNQVRHEAVPISLAQFQEVTGLGTFPPGLRAALRDGALQYQCNAFADYTLRGAHTRIEVLWNWEAPTGEAGDVYEAIFRGSNARIELRQGAAEHFIPEVYVMPASGNSRATDEVLDREIVKWQSRWPGIAAKRGARGIQIVIPERMRLSHEDHFGQVAARFLQYARAPRTLPEWERTYMLAKYAVTTAPNR